MGAASQIESVSGDKSAVRTEEQLLPLKKKSLKAKLAMLANFITFYA